MGRSVFSPKLMRTLLPRPDQPIRTSSVLCATSGDWCVKIEFIWLKRLIGSASVFKIEYFFFGCFDPEIFDLDNDDK